MITTVLFDVDGVLLDSFEANLKFFQDLMIRTGYTPPNHESFKLLFHVNMRECIKILTGLKNDEEIDRIWHMGKTRMVPYNLDLLATPPDLEEVIAKLSKKYTLGIVTSRLRETTYESPKLARYKQYFGVTVCYQDTEKHKPNPEPLLLAAQTLNVSPDSCVYVGDVINDVTAAHKAGMQVILYNKTPLDEADACTAYFPNIPEIISKLDS